MPVLDVLRLRSNCNIGEICFCALLYFRHTLKKSVGLHSSFSTGDNVIMWESRLRHVGELLSWNNYKKEKHAQYEMAKSYFSL